MAAGKASDDDYAKVIDYLFIGSKTVARDKEKLLSLGITHVVNCTVERSEGGCHNYFENEPLFQYMRCPVQDSDAASLKDYFDKVVPFVDAAREKGHGVLIHCQQGVSRSSTITIAYLMKSQKMSLMDAYITVKSKRPVVKPKKNFLRELQEYEKSMNKPVETKKEVEVSKDASEAENSSNRRKREDGLEGDVKASRPEENKGSMQKKRRIGPSCGPPPSSVATSLRDNIAAAAAAASSKNSNDIASKKTLRKIGPSRPSTVASKPTTTSTSNNKRRIGPSMPPK
eukprot:jgi/Bigna1/142724/aug1.72_g17432